jgi:molybdopterin-guanine dinucleotide biosynthesis protein B
VELFAALANRRRGVSCTISIVGKSEAGKTTLLEQLIGELKRRGYRVGAVKHEPYGFELDQPGKDSWRLAQAGSDAIVLSSPQRLAIISQVERDTTLEELSHLLDEDFDLILAEGFRGSNAPKIEVHRKGLGELLCPPEELFAIVTDEPLDFAVPQYSPDNVPELADIIEERASALGQVEDIQIWVNGTPIPANPFVKEFISKTLLGMVSALKGVQEVKGLRISLRESRSPASS